MDHLGTVLALLHGAPDRVRRLRAEVVSRVDAERAAAAFEHRTRSEQGATFYMAFSEEDEEEEPEGGEHDERARIWVDVEAGFERAERTGMRQAIGVRRGAIWWRWDPQDGAISNEADDGDVTTTIAEELGWMLGGLQLAGALRFTSVATGDVAGRQTWRCRTVPRPGEETRFALHALPGYGADEYDLDVDAETGLVLRVAGRFEGEVFTESEVVDIGLDEVLDDELFTFVSPDGSPARSFEDAHGRHHMHLTPQRLLELADFALFGPGRRTAGWDATLGFGNAIATMHLHAEDGLRSVSITQSDAGTDDDAGWEHADPAPWQREEIDGIEYEFRDPKQDWQPARVRFERDGTRVLIDSNAFTAAELLDLAQGMVPLPGGSAEPADEGGYPGA